MNYSFDFSGLTIGDIQSIALAQQSGDVSAYFTVVRKCYPQMDNVSLAQSHTFFKQFNRALETYLATTATSDAIRLLRQLADEWGDT